MEKQRQANCQPLEEHLTQALVACWSFTLPLRSKHPSLEHGLPNAQKSSY